MQKQFEIMQNRKLPNISFCTKNVKKKKKNYQCMQKKIGIISVI